MNLLSKTLVGTASFGSQYGLANQRVMLSNEVAEVIHSATKHGMYGFDTAQDYSLSEEMLRQAQGGAVFTKLSKNVNYSSRADIITQSKISLSRLCRDYVDGLSFHSASQLLSDPRNLQDAMMELKQSGLVRSWGVSLYDPEELDRILKVSNPDFVQVPLNAINQAFLDLKILDQLQSRRIELHARSVFLQGTLLMNPESLPGSLQGLRQTIKKLEAASDAASVEIRDFLVGFVGSQSAVSKIVIGVNSPRQLTEYLESCERLSRTSTSGFVFTDPQLDPSLADPRFWRVT